VAMATGTPLYEIEALMDLTDNLIKEARNE
jgi:hypothetical protein